MIFATLAFAGILAVGVFLGRWFAHHHPSDAVGAVVGLGLIGTSVLALTG
ncbi:hypothetical protein [Aureimonas flava]|nr:hypothetical protein [Aureimonas flava]